MDLSRRHDHHEEMECQHVLFHKTLLNFVLGVNLEGDAHHHNHQELESGEGVLPELAVYFTSYPSPALVVFWR